MLGSFFHQQKTTLVGFPTFLQICSEKEYFRTSELKRPVKAFINAFIELRSHKELERITIKELCEKARINKSTFYSHYHDIYHLSDTLETEVVVSIMENLSHSGRCSQKYSWLFQRAFHGISCKGFPDRDSVFRKSEQMPGAEN